MGCVLGNCSVIEYKDLMGKHGYGKAEAVAQINSVNLYVLIGLWHLRELRIIIKLKIVLANPEPLSKSREGHLHLYPHLVSYFSQDSRVDV